MEVYSINNCELLACQPTNSTPGGEHAAAIAHIYLKAHFQDQALFIFVHVLHVVLRNKSFKFIFICFVVSKVTFNRLNEFYLDK